MPDGKLLDDIYVSVEKLEDSSLNKHMLRLQHYETIQKTITNHSISSAWDIKLIDRLLAICTQDITSNMKYAVNSLNVIESLCKKILKDLDHSLLSNLVPSAASILHLLIAADSLNKMKALQLMCFETLLSYPDDALSKLTITHADKVFRTIILYLTQSVLELKLKTYDVLDKLLKVLPLKEKSDFIRVGIDVWFSTVIPDVLDCMPLLTNKQATPILEVLDMLTEELIHYNYDENLHWKIMLKQLITSDKYTNTMKAMLHNDLSWWRVWKVFILLLKNQIIVARNHEERPISVMLPIVETAFKMDLTKRLKAFECWETLIEILSKQMTNHNRVKITNLLLTPLYANNAKVGDIAAVKFRCWWLMIELFQKDMEKNSEKILIPFLNFCFGKHDWHVGVEPLPPGLLSSELSDVCLQAFVEIVENKDYCAVNIRKLNSKIFNSEVLKACPDTWFHCFKTALIMLAFKNDKVSKNQAQCLWKSLLFTINEVHDKELRNELLVKFVQVISFISQHSTTCKHDRTELVMDIILFLFEEKQLHRLLESKNGLGIIYKIIPLFNNIPLHNRFIVDNSCNFLRSTTNTLIDDAITSPDHLVNFLINNLIANNDTLVLWTSLVDSVMTHSKYEFPVETLTNVMLWPIKHINSFTETLDAASIWTSLFDLNCFDNVRAILIEEIMETLIKSNCSSSYLMLAALLGLLKYDTRTENVSTKFKTEIQLLETVLKNLSFHEDLFKKLSSLFDIVILLIKKLNSSSSTEINKHVFNILQEVYNIIIRCLEISKHTERCVSFLEHSFELLEPLLKNETYLSLLIHNIVQLKNLQKFNIKISCLNNIMKVIMDKKIENDSGDTCKDQTNPKTNKKTKKANLSIIDTISDNGEEYVVVKSNWHFNPKKLTENQKEKLTQKREDIPALYQDLSQSQDEVNLKIWKTDSQDTLTSSSSTIGVPNISTNLQNIVGSNLVPTIINVLTDNKVTKNEKESKTNTVEGNIIEATHKNNKKSDLRSNIKNLVENNGGVKGNKEKEKEKICKTPNLSLQDKVMRNVKILLENHLPLKSDSILPSEKLLQTTPQPTSKRQLFNVPHSAPSKLTCERPSRLKKTPRKFLDSEFIPIKKKHFILSPDEIKANTSDTSNCQQKISVFDEKDVQYEEDLKKRERKRDLCIKNKNDESKENCDTNINSTPLTILIHCSNKTNDSTLSNALISNDIIEDSDPNYDKIKFNIAQDDLGINKNSKESKLTTPSLNLSKKVKSSSSKSFSDKKTRIQKALEIDMVEGHPYLTNGGTPPSDKRSTRKRSKTHLESKNAVNTKLKLTFMSPNTAKKTNKKNGSMNITETRQLTASEDFIESSQGSDVATVTLNQKKSKLLPEKQEEIKETKSIINPKSSSLNKLDKSYLTANKIENNKDGKASKHLLLELDHEKQSTKNLQLTFKTNADRNCRKFVDSEDKLCTKDINASDSNKKETPMYNSDLFLNIENPTEICNETFDVETEQINKDVIIIDDDDDGDNDCKGCDDSLSLLSKQNIAEADTQPNCLSDNNKVLQSSIMISQSRSKDDKLNLCYDTQENESDSSLFAMDRVEKDTENSRCGSNFKLFTNETVSKNESSNTEPAKIRDTLLKKDIESIKSNNILDLSEIKNNSIDNNLSEKSELSNNLEKTENVTIFSSIVNENERNKDFLNSTLEISPIKILSPLKNDKLPSPENSNDYVVIKLKSPVQSNGEPFDLSSPEVFTEEKNSPEKSPNREDTVLNSLSPESCKKNTQIQSSGRGAQMLGLCVPNKLQNTVPFDKSSDENKTSTCNLMPAKRNLKILYNSIETDIKSSSAHCPKFLKLQKPLPSADSSPVCPILKRKLADITDESTPSPACKRKRVSFHDPPVLKTVAVQKYIEPLRSPQNSALKRNIKPSRYNNIKSPKKLENLFNLEVELQKTADICTTEEISKLDGNKIVEQTPDQTDESDSEKSICPELCNSDNPIKTITECLSLEEIKNLVDELEKANIKTVGALAKISYSKLRALINNPPELNILEEAFSKYLIDNNSSNKELNQASCHSDEGNPIDIGIKELDSTVADIKKVIVAHTSLAETQTESKSATEASVQTDLTDDAIIALCKINFKDGDLSTKWKNRMIMDILSSKPDDSVMKATEEEIESTNDFIYLQEFLLKRYNPKDISKLCISLLNKIVQENL